MSAKKLVQSLFFAINALPLVLPAALASFGAVTIIFLLAGHFDSGPVWAIGSAAAIASTIAVLWYFPDKYKTSTELNICNIVVLSGLVVWGAFNSLFVSQHLITNRDPGVYTNAGLWLVHHTSLSIDVPSVFGNVPGVMIDSGGFSNYFVNMVPHLYAQGLHLLPAFLGLAGRAMGDKYIFHLNILFGMMALLAIYGFARMIVRPFWAMVAAGVLAASMPFIFFSRDTYSELLAATFTFGALALLGLALKNKKWAYWFLAGLVAGAGTLTRIDGFLTIAGISVFLFIYLAGEVAKDRRLAIRNTAAAFAGMFVTGLIGWLDVSRLSIPYYISTRDQFYQEIILIIFIVIAGSALVYFSWYKKLLSKVDRVTKNWRSTAAAATVLFLALVLASRPLWYRGHSQSGGAVNHITRNFAELSTEWISWYIGPLLALLGIVGLAIAAYRIVKKRNMLLTATFIVFASTSLIYLNLPNIAPDQIWAARRLIPVILPGVVIFGVYAIEQIDLEYFKKLQWKWFFMIVLGLGLLLGPLITSRPVILEHDMVLYQPISSICDSLPTKAAVMWLGLARTQLIQPTKELCDIPAEGYGTLFSATDRPGRAVLAKAAANARKQGYFPFVGLFGKDAELLPESDQKNLTTVDSFTYNQLDNPIGNPPQKVGVETNSIKMGIIQPDGSIKPLLAVPSSVEAQ